MTPKEKAKELVGKFYYGGYKKPMFYYNAKKCALIAVDEIIDSNPTEINETFYLRPYTSEYLESSTTYWDEVKQEIEAL